LSLSLLLVVPFRYGKQKKSIQGASIFQNGVHSSRSKSSQLLPFSFRNQKSSILENGDGRMIVRLIAACTIVYGQFNERLSSSAKHAHQCGIIVELLIDVLWLRKENQMHRNRIIRWFWKTSKFWLSLGQTSDFLEPYNSISGRKIFINATKTQISIFIATSEGHWTNNYYQRKKYTSATNTKRRIRPARNAVIIHL
jgi:hypothetical protein